MHPGLERVSAIADLLQRGRARAGAECPLLLLPLAQARNTSIAIACADSIAFMLMLHHSLVIIGLL